MSWDDEATTWDEHPAVVAYGRAAYRSLQAVLAGRGRGLEGARVFDFGCGTGLLTQAMATQARQVVALDLSSAMVAVLEAKGLANVEAIAGGLHDLVGTPPLGLGSFDLVTCSSVCAFLDDYPATLALLVPLLAPGGLFVQWDWELDPTAEEPYGLSRDAIRQALEASGLVEITVAVGFEEPFEDAVMAPIMGVGQLPRVLGEHDGPGVAGSHGDRQDPAAGRKPPAQ